MLIIAISLFGSVARGRGIESRIFIQLCWPLTHSTLLRYGDGHYF